MNQLKNLILKIIPKSLTKRIAFLFALLAISTIIINIVVVFFFEYSSYFKHAKSNIDSQFSIMSKDVSEAIITDDIYRLYSVVEEVSKNISHIDNIIVLDNNGNYITDARVLRKIPAKTDALLEIDKKIVAGQKSVGMIAFYISKSSIRADVFSKVGYLMLINMVILIGGVFMGMFLSKVLISPLISLSNQISTINVLELPYRFNLSSFSSNETIKLKEVIEGLSSRLQDSLEHISQHHKEMARSERLAYLGTMSAGLAHELKNPIMSINLILDSMMKENSEDQKFSEDYTMLKSQAEKLVYRINEFLEYSKPVKIEKESFSIFELAKEIKKQSFAELDIAFDIDEDAFVFSDMSKISQICQILFNNSKEAGAESVLINIQLAEANLMIKYRDNGKGFSDVDMSKVMLPFYTTKKGGVGLGLAICATILDAMQGHIEIDSDCASGAGFNIYIPQEAV